MASVGEIRDYLDRTVPFSMKMDFDNVGLLAGFRDAEAQRVLVALDITEAVIGEAEACGAALIVSHHPLIFHPLRQVTDEEPVGRKLIRLLRGGRSAICLHTNLDVAEDGVNDALAEALGLETEGILEKLGAYPDGRPYGLGRVGRLPAPMRLEDFLALVRSRLSGNGLRYIASGRPVSRVACCGGAGGDALEEAAARGCDTYVTADLKYDRFLQARDLGINLIDADHFCTENVVVPRLCRMLREAFPETEVLASRVHGQAVQFFCG